MIIETSDLRTTYITPDEDDSKEILAIIRRHTGFKPERGEPCHVTMSCALVIMAEVAHLMANE